MSVSEITETEIVQVVREANLAKTDQQNILSVLGTAFDRISEFRSKADQIQVRDEFDRDGINAARELRLAIKETRVEGDKARKKLKEDALRKGQTIDAVWRIIKNGLEPIESELEEKEKIAEIAAAKRREELKENRIAELAKHNFDGSLFPLGDMPEEAYNQILQGAIAAEQKRIADEKAAENERLAAEKAEAERLAKIEAERQAELARVKAENERLAAEAKARQEAEEKAAKELAAKREKSKAAAEKALIKLGFSKENGGYGHSDVQYFIGEKHYSELDSNEEYLEFIDQTKQRLAELIAAKAAKEEAEKAQAELIAAKKREEERLASEAKAKREQEEAQKAARLTPDKEKLTSLATEIENYQLPELSNPEADAIIKNIRTLLLKTAQYAREQASKL